MAQERVKVPKFDHLAWLRKCREELLGKYDALPLGDPDDDCLGLQIRALTYQIDHYKD